MLVRPLTQRALNRALLARQLLLERSTLSIPQALEHVAGIQNQHATNSYIRLCCCLERFERDALTRALEDRTVVQGTLMRSTLHMVSAGDYWLFAAGVRQARRNWWFQLNKGGATEHEIGKYVEKVRTAFKAGPLSQRELKQLAPVPIGLWLDLVRIPPSGTWEKRRADLYLPAEQWLGPDTATEEQGFEHLVRRYLGAFGPASLDSMAAWAGVHPAVLEPAVNALGLRLENPDGEPLWDIPGGRLPEEDSAAPPRFLPPWDTALLVHARRTGIIPEPYRKIVFDVHKPQSMGTFLLDGSVRGAWKFERDRVVLEPFEVIPRNARRALNGESERLRELVKETRVKAGDEAP